MDDFHFARPQSKEGGHDKQKFELFNDLMKFQYKIVTDENDSRRQVSNLYSKFLSEMSRHSDYMPVFIAKKRQQI